MLKLKALLNKKSKNWIHWVVGILFAFILNSILLNLPLDYFESLTYDWRVSLRPTPTLSGKIQTVAIDNRTLKEFGNEPNIKDHLEFLEQLLKAQPSYIVYLIDPSSLLGSKEEKQKLADKLNSAQILISQDNLPGAEQTELPPLPIPFQNLKTLPGPTTRDKIIYARDGVTRRFIISSNGAPTYQVILAEKMLSEKLTEIPGEFEFLDSKQAYIDFHKPGTYLPLSFSDLKSGLFNAENIKGKVILLGRETKEKSLDYVSTPFSKDVISMSVLELNANILDTLLQKRSPQKVAPAFNWVVTFIILLTTIYVVLKISPLKGLIVLTLLATVYIGISFSVFAFFNYWIAMAPTLLGLFISYYFFIPYRLVLENRRSWEYLQKNKLLVQVEELKSNFLRMMSHDLKTPLARIQGMAHLIISDHNPLSEKQKTAVENIYSSSEELTQFVGSILNLSRIESKEVKLQLKSRDINLVLKEVIQKCEDLSRKNRLEIRTELEPLFSFKIDENLLRQVFTNLLENAIKYSPVEGKILVTSEESNGNVIIQISDQGMGIPEPDLPFIFDRFYRSKNALQSEVSGSGLGLYLSKYFVELHHGHIEVESFVGKGSTFSVVLPMINKNYLEKGKTSAAREDSPYV